MSSDDSTAETDYGDVNLENILQGNFSVQSAEGDVGRNYGEGAKGSTNASNHQHGDLPRDKEIMQIMSEFNLLMKEIGEDVSDHSKKEISQSVSNYRKYNTDAATAYMESQLMQNDMIQNKNFINGTVGSNYHSGHDNYENERITYEGKDIRTNSASSSYATTDDYLRIEKKIIDFVRREDNGEVETNPNFLMLAAQSRRPDKTTILRNRDSEFKPEIQNPVSSYLGKEFSWSVPLHKVEFDNLHLPQEVGNRRDRVLESSTRSSVDSVDSEDSLVPPTPAHFDVEDRDAVLLRSSQNSAVDWSSSSLSTSTQPYNILSSVKDALNSRTPISWMSNRDDSRSNALPLGSTVSAAASAASASEDTRRNKNDTTRLHQSESVQLSDSRATDRQSTANGNNEEAFRSSNPTRSSSSLLDLYRDGGDRTATQSQSQYQSSVDNKRVSFQQPAQQPQVRVSSSYSDSSFLLPGPKQEADFDERNFHADVNHLHDDAIRSASRENMVEIEKMTRMNRTLIDALSEERAVRQRLEEKLASHGDELAMLKTQSDVDLDSYRLEVIRLKSQLRAVCEEKSLADIYSAFEADITRLLKENGSLRRVNLELETKDLDKAMLGERQPSGTSASPSTTTTATASYLLEVANKENNRLLLKLKKSGQEREALREQFETLKMRERQFLMSSKLAHDASRRLRSSHQDLQRARKALDAEQLKAAGREKDLQLLRSDCEQTRQAEQSLRSERARLLAEMSLLRDRVRQAEDEKRRSVKIDKFIGKHASADAHGFDEPRTLPGYHSRKVTPPRSVWQGLPLQSAAGLGFNYSQGMYLRSEEQNPSDSIAMEEAMGALHEGLIAQCPALLPAFRRLGEQIHHERAKALERTSSLLSLLGHGSTDSAKKKAFGSVSTESNRPPKSSSSVTRRADESVIRNRSLSPASSSSSVSSSSSASASKLRTLTPSTSTPHTSNSNFNSNKSVRSSLQREQDMSSSSRIEPPVPNISINKDDAYTRLLRSLDPGRLTASRTSKAVSFEL
eukprot:gene26052-34656_t